MAAVGMAIQHAQDPAVTVTSTNATAVPDVFNYYLAQVTSQPAPDVLAVFPGIDRTQPMQFTTYAQGIMSYAQAHNIAPTGLRGLAGLAGLGNASPYWHHMGGWRV